MFDRLKMEKNCSIVKEVESQITEVHKRADEVIESNQFRVLESFRKHKISDSHFIPTTGYGYDDIGRDTLEKVYADVFGRKLDLFVRKLFQVLTLFLQRYSVFYVQEMSCCTSLENRMIR